MGARPVSKSGQAASIRSGELSGAQWTSKFPGSTSTKDLSWTFREAVESFIGAMAEAGMQVKVSATFRLRKRSYLMHWCWMIAHRKISPADVPAMDGVDINWAHSTEEAAILAAKQMVAAFEMGTLKTPPALRSLHNEGRAIDMTISWSGNVRLRDGAGEMVTVTTHPRSGMNRDLRAVGASYGVRKFLGGSKDKPHWSTTGR